MVNLWKARLTVQRPKFTKKSILLQAYNLWEFTILSFTINVTLPKLNSVVFFLIKFISTKYFLLNLFSQDMGHLKQIKCSWGNSHQQKPKFVFYYREWLTDHKVPRKRSPTFLTTVGERKHSDAKTSWESYNPTWCHEREMCSCSQRLCLPLTAQDCSHFLIVF